MPGAPVLGPVGIKECGRTASTYSHSHLDHHVPDRDASAFLNKSVTSPNLPVPLFLTAGQAFKKYDVIIVWSVRQHKRIGVGWMQTITSTFAPWPHKETEHPISIWNPLIYLSIDIYI